MIHPSRNMPSAENDSRQASMSLELSLSEAVSSHRADEPQEQCTASLVTRNSRTSARPSHRFVPLWMAGLIILYSSSWTVNAFVAQRSQQQWHMPTKTASSRRPHTSPPSTALSMSLQDVSDFYAQFPMQSAILTCGVKASLADSLAQFKDSVAAQSSDIKHKLQKNLPDQSFNWEFRRNLAYVIYGGIFVGLMCHLEYNVLFPVLFGSEHTTKTIFEKVI
ncbi:MAG: hypothetical protein SGARI_005847, partial [Bacillariaceae sp.]